MSCKGDCWDNGVAESFFSNLKNEAMHDLLFLSQAEGKAVVGDYIERITISSGYIKPWAIKRLPPSKPHSMCLNDCPEYPDHLNLTLAFLAFAVEIVSECQT